MATNNSINSGNATTGSVLTGNTGAAPSFSATPSVTSISISNAPVSSTDGVNKAYADAISAGFNFKNSTYCATTGALTATYLNGVSGVGATLTNGGALAAFSVDGQSPAINSRILVKNQASSFQNGIYTLTTVGSGAIAWVLTRSTGYDQASEIQSGDIVPVEFGTTNANTLWLQTATVVTMGVDAITFTKFLGNGIVTVTGDTGGALTGTNITFAGGTTGLSFGGSGTTETLTFAGITANGGTVSLATDATTSTINVGTGAGVKTSSFGSTNTTSATTLQSGSGALNVTATNGALTVNSGTGALGLSTDASATTVSLATGGAVKGVTLGSTNSTSSTTVQSGSGALAVTSTNGTLTINSGTGALGISTDASATTVSLATGAAVKGVTLGSVTSTSATTVRCGSGALALTSTNGTWTGNSGTGALGLSTDASATTVSLATGGAVKTVTLGSTNSTSATTVQSGSGALAITSTNGTWTGNSGTGALGLSTDASATTVSLATGAAVKGVTLGSVTSTSATTVQSGSGALNVTATNGALTIKSGTGTLAIGNDATAQTITFATGAGVKTTTLGSTNTTSATTVQSGSGALNITATGGALTINSGAGAINIGTSSSDQAIHIGDNNASSKTITIGEIIGNTGVTIKGGNGGMLLSNAGTGQAISLTPGSGGVSVSNFVTVPTTTSTTGQYQINGQAVLHNGGSNHNTYVGGGAGNFTSTTDLATAVGWQSQVSLTSGQQNTSVGSQSLQRVTTGGYNVCMGPLAGYGYTGAESSNIQFLNQGVTGESNVIRIGGGAGTGAGQQNKAFIYGIRGITTVNADAVAVLVDSAGQLGTVSSSIRYKENVVDMGDVSAPLLSLRPVTFDFIGKPSYKKQVGLIAEEVKEIMPDLVVHNQDGEVESVKYHELPVLLLNELQKALKRIEVLEEKLAGK